MYTYNEHLSSVKFCQDLLTYPSQSMSCTSLMFDFCLKIINFNPSDHVLDLNCFYGHLMEKMLHFVEEVIRKFNVYYSIKVI